MPRVMRVENWLANAPARPGVRYQRGYWKNGDDVGRYEGQWENGTSPNIYF